VYSDTQFSELQAAFYSIRSLKWKYIRIVPPRPNLSFLKEFFKYFIAPQNILEVLSSPQYFIHRIAKNDREFLFDLFKDKSEENNIASIERKQVSIFRKELKRWLDVQENKSIPSRQMEISEEEEIKARLKELGYL